MDLLELHALEKSHLLSLITIPNQQLDRDMELLETKPHNIHQLLIHQPQFQQLFFKLNQSKVLTRKQLQLLELDLTIKDTQHRKKFLYLILKLLEHTHLSMLNNENEK